ncbi:N-acetyltransferase [Streptomyces sp. NPDC047108]|uniref:GNAT family N-acetyltransferase n=1 Tax=Streptomyces sp. NPDC047108 TaxID=3155025 RepID=UPI0033CBCEEA
MTPPAPGSGASPAPAPVPLRRAGPGDARALTGLRALMFREMGTEDGGPDALWRRASEQWFAARLGDPREAAAFVVDDPELGVVCSAVGICDPHAPGPANPSGRHGHVFNISTDPRRRRLGYARACLEALLSWYRDESGVDVVHLHATPDGLRLYRSVGFGSPPFDALQLRLPTPITPE